MVDQAFLIAIWGSTDPPANALKEALRKCRAVISDRQLGDGIEKDGDHIRWVGFPL